MQYISLPYVESSSWQDQYYNGVFIYRLRIGSQVTVAIKACSRSDNEVRCGLYTEENSTYMMFATRLRETSVCALKVETNGYIYNYIINTIPEWEEGSSEWYYAKVDITSYINDNYTTELDVFTSLSECFSALVGTILDKTIYVLVQYKKNDTNDQGGTSEIGGGEGTFDDESDNIPLTAKPGISAHNSGLITIFRPSIEQIRALGNYLWTNIDDFIENMKKMFSNPMDYLISFHIVPCIPDVGAIRNVKLGLWDTEIYMPPVTSQWYEFSCGTVNIPLYWGSALDYAPNTKISLFLPFVGNVQINTDEVMGQDITITYRVDLLSGQCVALVSVSGNVLYQYTGECSVSIPLTGSDWSRIYSAAIGALGVAASGAVGVSAAMSAGTGMASMTAAQSYNAAANAGASYAAIADSAKGLRGAPAMRQKMADIVESAMANAQNAARMSGNRSNGIAAMRLSGTINNTVGQVMSGKGNVMHTGTISGSSSILGIRTPYFIIEYPNQSLAENYKHFVGYPSNIFSKLGDLTGYTEVEKALISIEGTDDELAEIMEALKGGVYL